MKRTCITLPLAIVIIAALVLASCGSPTASPAPTPSPKPGSTQIPAASAVSLNGAGATFPGPLYTKWFDAYNKLTGLKINYQPIGSGGGIRQITEGTVDFGASDGIMTAEEQAKAEKATGPIVHIPMTIGAVAIIYNLPSIGSGQLKLTPDVVADIYLKKITKWNDPRILSLNPVFSSLRGDIAVVYRSDGSGTTFIFTNYLSRVSSAWKTKVGNATSVNFPGDIGGKGNAGVAGQVQQLPNSIGYVELAYARQNKISWAKLKNQAGSYIEPTMSATTKAAEGVTLPDDMKVMLTNSANTDAYPIVGFTWILAYVNQKDKNKGATLAKVLWWAIHDGQQYAEPLDYARLSGTTVTKAENQVLSLKNEGQPLIKR